MDLIDDFDGSPAVRTVRITLDMGEGEQVAYLEVNEENRDLIEATMAPWFAAGRATPEPDGLAATAADAAGELAAGVAADDDVAVSGNGSSAAVNGSTTKTVAAASRNGKAAAKNAPKGRAKGNPVSTGAGAGKRAAKSNRSNRLASASVTNGKGSPSSNEEIRRWLRDNGHEVSDRGTISAKNRQLYADAHR